ncbi:hypothetical protein GCM10011519_11750 [Marmoricola endophyticus]|uniref:DinB family protein n=1 Tax=Marmoricola endophyticus TaxID=2040280 RepID=A0A917BEK9_9ACTN|nr:DinB family protein [Marmoricola endophyticus]GGF39755.1 hypothetical protein GCM10011519_11750 [Marmoricola endophyticus]
MIGRVIPALDPMQNRSASERTQLLAFLDAQRAEVEEALTGLADAQARERLVPSLTSPLAILKHLVFVEQNWFHHVLAGRSRTDVGIADDSQDSWVLTDDDTVEGLLADYRRVCLEAREIVASYDLDEVRTHRFMGEVSLRFVLLHMIRETARHAGHADILREQVLAGPVVRMES